MNGRLLCSKPLELLRERCLPIMGVLRLLLTHHVDHLNPTQDRTSTVHCLEPEHRSDSPLDGSMILLNAIIKVGTLPDADRLQLSP